MWTLTYQSPDSDTGDISSPRGKRNYLTSDAAEIVQLTWNWLFLKWNTEIVGDLVEIVCLTGKEYVIGRKNTDIILANDQSISRKHATLCVHFKEQDLVGGM